MARAMAKRDVVVDGKTPANSTRTGRSRRQAPPGLPPAPGKPTLYLDVVGALVLQEGSEFRVAPFAQEFIESIKDSYRIVLLTSLTEPIAIQIARHFDAELAYGEYRKGLGKITGIDVNEPFLWIEHTPSPRDLMRLAEERRSSHLIAVNGKEGVTRQTLEKLIRCREELYGPSE